MIEFDRALRIVLSSELPPMGAEIVPVIAALGRVVKGDVGSTEDVPAFDNSAMDGFAVRSEDIRNVPAKLRVVLDLPAGSVASRPLALGEAARIMTGAPIPPGADTVVRVEDTEEAEGTVTVLKHVEAGRNIRHRGEDVRRGSTAIRNGTVLRAQEIGVLGSIGRVSVVVAQRPRVAILSTGDELVECHEPVGPGQVRNSNSLTLASLVRMYGGEPILLGIARDNLADLRERLAVGLAADMLVTTGGVSVGKYDLVKDVLGEAGLELRFWRVAMRPGMPTAFGLVRGKPVFALPGNPVAVVVTFYQFVRPALLQMMGARCLRKPVVRAVLHSPVEKAGGRLHFVSAYAWAEDSGFHVEVRGSQGAGILSSLTLANSLILVPPDSSGYRTGDTVTVQLLDASEVE